MPGRGGCRSVVGGLKSRMQPPPSRQLEKDTRMTGGGGGNGEKGRESGGGGGVLKWKNTISPALLQCLSSQLVTLKYQS